METRGREIGDDRGHVLTGLRVLRAMVAVVVVAEIVAAWRGLSSAGDMGGQGSSSATPPMLLSGMPLSEMPEMFIAAGALAVAIAASWRSREARRLQRVVATGRVQVGVLTAALAIDVSKTSSLGFVIPGLRKEYGLTSTSASLLAVAGLSGTTIGAILVRTAAGRLRRRDVYLLSALGFAVTSNCAMMPTFTGNLVMCLLMGITVGGLAPVLVAALRDCTRGSSRGGIVVAASILASALGFLIAAGTATWLEPQYGWRILWLIGAPTGLLIATLAPLVGETSGEENAPAPVPVRRQTIPRPIQYLYALMTGVVAFGVTTWTPTLVRGDISVQSSNRLLTAVALALIPVAVVVGTLYARYGPVAVTSLVAIGSGFVLLALVISAGSDAPVWLSAAALAGTIFCVNTMSAVFLPIAANLAAPVRRTKVVATVSAFNRVGGLTGPLLLAGLVSSKHDISIAIATLAAACIALAFTVRFHLSRPR